MSATAPAPAPLQSRFAPRLLGAVAIVVIGFVSVWGGFGLAGFGTDAHVSRVLAAIAPLFVCGLVLVWPRWSPLRAVVGLVGLVAASVAWWYVPTSDVKNGMSLRDAVKERDFYKGRLAITTVEEAVKSEGQRGIKHLLDQYPSLAKDLPDDYDRWAAGVADDIIARYRRAPLDDFKSVEALREPVAIMSKAYPAGADRLDAARRQWLSNALHAKTHELSSLKPGDWTGFNATAFGRSTLADALPDTRNAVLCAEADWVDSSVETIVANKLTPKAGESPPTREFWKQTNWDVLALKSLDAAENRFVTARRRLFKVAHDAAAFESLMHFEAGRYDLAFGVARTHSVDWFIPAAALGGGEEKSLAELRGTYAFFNMFTSKSAKPPDPLETAPPPRTKP